LITVKFTFLHRLAQKLQLYTYVLLPNADRFSESFPARLGSTLCVNLLLMIGPYLEHVATLACEVRSRGSCANLHLFAFVACDIYSTSCDRSCLSSGVCRFYLGIHV